MAQDIQALFEQIRPKITQEIYSILQKKGNTNQYTVTSIPVHTHNNIDSPQVPYNNLGGVKNYLASNTITLTSTQIKALNTTPIVIIPPPAARSVIIVHMVTARLTYGGTAYTGLHNMEIHYTNGAGTQITAPIPPTFINSTSSTFYHAPAISDGFVPVEGGSSQNGQVVVFVNTANPATGNSNITLTIHYHVVSFAS